MTTAAHPRFSLVVATFGRVTEPERLVSSLLDQSERSFEVIVADQNRDGRLLPVLEPLAKAGLITHHIRGLEPSASAARNAGLRAAVGDIVAFPDDDCWYEPDTLAKARAVFDADPGLDGLAGRWAEAGAMPGDERLEVTNEDMRRFRAGNLACITLLLRRELLARVGGFDERFGPGRWYAGAEETDLVLSFLGAGGRLRRAPGVVVHHPAEEGPLRVARRHPLSTERARARGTGALYAKHGLSAWVVARGMVGPFAVRPGADLITGAAKVIGRFEGFVGWRAGRGGSGRPSGSFREGQEKQVR